MTRLQDLIRNVHRVRFLLFILTLVTLLHKPLIALDYSKIDKTAVLSAEYLQQLSSCELSLIKGVRKNPLVCQKATEPLQVLMCQLMYIQENFTKESLFVDGIILDKVGVEEKCRYISTSHY